MTTKAWQEQNSGSSIASKRPKSLDSTSSEDILMISCGYGGTNERTHPENPLQKTHEEKKYPVSFTCFSDQFAAYRIGNKQPGQSKLNWLACSLNDRTYSSTYIWQTPIAYSSISSGGCFQQLQFDFYRKGVVWKKRRVKSVWDHGW